MQLKYSENKQNRGFTLVELMIYIVLVSMIISYAFSLLTTTSRSYVRSREVSKVQTNGRYAAAILARDVMNTGYKTILLEEDGVTRIKQLPGTWTGNFAVVSPADDSAASFLFFPGNPCDTLEIFKAEMDSVNILDEVVRIRYTIDDNNILWRTTQTFDSTVTGNWVAGAPLALSKNIEALQFRFSENGSDWFDNLSGNRDLIRSIQIELLVKTEREVIGKTGKSYSMGDIIITPTGTDEYYIRRHYTEIVEIVNNRPLF